MKAACDAARAGGCADRCRLRGRVPGRLDHEARHTRRRAPDHPLDVLVRRPTRGHRPGHRRDRAGGRRARRRPGGEPDAVRGPDRGIGPHGPRLRAHRGLPARSRRPASRSPRPCASSASCARRTSHRSTSCSSSRPSPNAPYGIKGVGEIGLVPTAGAVAAALHDYDGEWRTSLPMRRAAIRTIRSSERRRPMTAVTPGLVCGHHHLYSALARGMPAPPQQADRLPVDPRTDLVAARRRARPRHDPGSAMLGALEALECGTTAIVDHHESPNAIEGSLSVIAERAPRSGCGGVRLRRHRPPRHRAGAERGLAENERFLRAGGRGMVGVHAGFTCSDDTLEAAAGLAQRSRRRRAHPRRRGTRRRRRRRTARAAGGRRLAARPLRAPRPTTLPRHDRPQSPLEHEQRGRLRPARSASPTLSCWAPMASAPTCSRSSASPTCDSGRTT